MYISVYVCDEKFPVRVVVSDTGSSGHCSAVPLLPNPMFPSISFVVVDVLALVDFVDVEGVIVTDGSN